jgi:hypothetical protein
MIVIGSGIVAAFASFRLLFFEREGGLRTYPLLTASLLAIAAVWGVSRWA